MKRLLQGVLIGVILTAAAVYLLPRLTYQDPLSDKQRHVLAEHGFMPMVIVKEIHTTVPVPVEVIVKERFEVRVPSEPVEVVRTEFIETECPTENLIAPPLRVDIGGGCEIDVVGDMARAYWDCRVESDQGWSAERGPVLADQVTFELAKDAQEPRWRRHAWLGPWKVPDGWGGMAGVSGQGRKWSAMVGVGMAPYESDSISTIFSDGEPIDFLISKDTTYEPSFFGMIGHRW